MGFLIVFLYQKADERVSKGMGLVFAIGQSQEKEIPLILVPLVTLATWLTHLFGGSAGREGVAVQLGAAIAHGFSRFFDFENNSRLFLLTGMAAGFAGLFQNAHSSRFLCIRDFGAWQVAITSFTSNDCRFFCSKCDFTLIRIGKNFLI